MPLSALAVSKAQVRDKAYKLNDADGLYLLVTPQGGRYWRLNYRLGGRYKTLALGVYPRVGLADARAARDKARSALAAGEDPMARKKRDALVATLSSATTFKDIAEEWLAKVEKEGRADITLSKIRWLLDFAYPLIGDRPIADVLPLELLAVLRSVEGRGRYESARRLRSVCGRVFRYAIATGRAQHDISSALRDALITPKVTHRAAITDPVEVGVLLRAIDDFTGHATTRAGLQLAAHLFVRPGELRHAEWSEIDLDGAVWTIPANKMKMRRPHRVPLSIQALDILSELRGITGSGQYVFPSFYTMRRPMSENTLNQALRRLGYTGEEMTSHGFRAMASTLLNETGKWHPDAIERQLAHVEGNNVRRAYARGEHWDERVRMMQSWSDQLDQLRSSGKVLKGAFGRR
jgi:integrase